MKYKLIFGAAVVWSGNDPTDTAEKYYCNSSRDCRLVAEFDNEQEETLHKKNMDDAIKRYHARLSMGIITSEECQRLGEWERRNFESGNVLYAYKIARAFLPKDTWTR